MRNLREILDSFVDVKVLIVGDVMLDRYWMGSVSRISPEAPVPVVKLKNVLHKAGGAANVAANISTLGAKPFLVGIIGEDETGSSLKKILEEKNVESDYLVALKNHSTTTKTRIVAHQQQVVRIDDESAQPLEQIETEIVCRKAVELLTEVDILVLSDYAKGCLNNLALKTLIEAACKANKPILVDPKGRDYTKYNGATLLTPNKSEATAVSGVEITDENATLEVSKKLLQDLQIDSLLITLGESGMFLSERNKNPKYFSAMARQVYDVTGAGDTVIATLATALGAGIDLEAAVQLANTAAGLAVEQIGTTTVTRTDLEKFFLEHQEKLL